MTKQQIFDIFKHNIIYIAVFGTGSLLLLLIGIWPQYYRIKEKEKEIYKLEYQIQKQAELKPMFREMVNSSSENNSSIINAIEQYSNNNNSNKKLNDTRVILNKIRHIAFNSGFRIESISPELNSMTKDTNFLPFSVNVKGNLKHLRIFLIQIGKVDFLEHVETISISRGDIQRLYDFSLRLWINCK